MTTTTDRPTNSAREQFLAIMRERQGKPQPKHTVSTDEARETVKAWRNSIKTLNDSRREIAKPLQPAQPRHITVRPCKAATMKAAEYLQNLKDGGAERPVSRGIEIQFGISEFTAKRLIREIFGKCKFRGWSKGRRHQGTEARYAAIRAKIAAMDKRPAQQDVSRQFNIGTRAAAVLIKECWGEFYPDTTMARLMQRRNRDERRANAQAFVDGLSARPTVDTVVKQFHINKYAASEIITAKFGRKVTR